MMVLICSLLIGRLLPGEVQRDTAATADGQLSDTEWNERRQAANEARKRQRREAKERDEHSVTPAASSSTPSSSSASGGAGQILAAALRGGIADANRLAALQFMAQHGNAEQKEAAIKKIAELAVV